MTCDCMERSAISGFMLPESAGTLQETRFQSRTGTGRRNRAGFCWRTTNRCGIAATAVKSTGAAAIRRAGRGSTVCLGDVQSYGFSFVGFSREVQGRLSMAEFEIVPGR